MHEIRSLQEFQSAIGDVKRSATEFSTNFYASPGQVDVWIERKSLFMIPSEGALLVLRRDRDIFHLSHAAADRKALAKSLGSLGQDGAPAYVADLLGRHGDIEPWVDVYRTAGFSPYKSLVRMSGPVPRVPQGDAPEAGVRAASPTEARRLLKFMEGLLDPLAEQIPELDDLEGWARAGTALVVEGPDSLDGIAIYEATGLSSVLRYWFVSAARRNRGIGGKLLRTLFRHCRDCRKMSLWVIADNHDSIAKYEHYGFKRDDVLDQILLRARKDPEGGRP